MNKTAKLGEKAPLLQISDWVQGNPTNIDQLEGRVILIEVFQVNCPGCFLYSLPQAISLHQKYFDKGLVILGMATAFEDFDKNTLENIELLATQNKVTGETLRALTENNHLINGQLPFHIPFPLAMDQITKHKNEITNNEVDLFIKLHFPDFIHQNERQKKQTQQNVLSYLQSRLSTAETFKLYNLQGTPSHIVIDKKGRLKACEFGHFSDLEWLISALLEE
ncbi:thiol-disulfide isomerase [Methyloprofundus sedimenti]|uniref:Thiol-disulfide isomerase n=1 Tax=Methyloprofundus sedimenti TaxID=1420851 RepID=A0A1V8M1A5_9GAMM|nr:thiol-disulfide isomerase [Methyloprofundus sedimenti]OQK15344.1 thiol-disulfide isomerase [Methyloprofundus sedimenti]